MAGRVEAVVRAILGQPEVLGIRRRCHQHKGQVAALVDLEAIIPVALGVVAVLVQQVVLELMRQMVLVVLVVQVQHH